MKFVWMTFGEWLERLCYILWYFSNVWKFCFLFQLYQVDLHEHNTLIWGQIFFTGVGVVLRSVDWSYMFYRLLSFSKFYRGLLRRYFRYFVMQITINMVPGDIYVISNSPIYSIIVGLWIIHDNLSIISAFSKFPFTSFTAFTLRHFARADRGRSTGYYKYGTNP